MTELWSFLTGYGIWIGLGLAGLGAVLLGGREIFRLKRKPALIVARQLGVLAGLGLFLWLVMSGHVLWSLLPALAALALVGGPGFMPNSGLAGPPRPRVAARLGPDGTPLPPEEAGSAHVVETMSPAEALAILGLPRGCTEEDVRAAHRRMMMRTHPDRGGSEFLVTKIAQARRVLLGE
ncbi:MAG: hypothetical protein HXY25_13220 [Alphaproteobacteria bacterium]|nr:hypothetical protein [Alphaproteobacteria bacterium]